jgi:hypothetical protein
LTSKLFQVILYAPPSSVYETLYLLRKNCLYAPPSSVYETLYLLRKNCLIKYDTEGKMEGTIKVTGRRGKRCKQLLDVLEETSGYWKLKTETLDITLW